MVTVRADILALSPILGRKYHIFIHKYQDSCRLLINGQYLFVEILFYLYVAESFKTDLVLNSVKCISAFIAVIIFFLYAVTMVNYIDLILNVKPILHY